MLIETSGHFHQNVPTFFKQEKYSCNYLIYNKLIFL